MSKYPEIDAVLAGESDGCIVCGDWYTVLDAAETPIDSVQLVVTDIPYNKVNRKTGGLRQIDKGEADSLPVDAKDIASLLSDKITGSAYMFCGTEQVSEIRSAWVAAGLTTRVCVWEKTNPSPMNGEHLWLSSLELCVFGRKPKATFTRFCASPVFRLPSKPRMHPCEKPVLLMEWLIDASSHIGDIVLDPFCGSGTTCVAAKRLGRRYIGIEIDEGYCEIARERVRTTTPPLFT